MWVMFMLVNVTGDNFRYEVEESPLPVLVEFYASWCGKCAMMEDVVAEFAADNEGRVKVCLVDSDSEESLAEELGVEKVPTFVVFRSGKAEGVAVGAVSRQTLDNLFR